MLTLILLVVLGGGAGLLAVWLIDARGLSGLVDRSGWRSLRRTPARDTARQAADEAPPAAPPPTTAAVAYVPVEVPLAPLPVESPRRGAQRVPAAYTAVEGSHDDVARTPLWRKVVSLVSLLGVLVLVAALLTALTGAAVGIAAELIDGAI